MLLVLGLLGGLDWSFEGPVVDGVEAGRRFGHLRLQFPQGLKAVDLCLVLQPLLPISDKR